MTYDPARLTPLDEIRFLAYDTGATEICSDTEYEASIAKYTNWKYAAAEMIEAVADRVDQKRTSFTAPGDVALSWSPQRTAGLRKKATLLRAEADAEENPSTVGTVTTLTMPYLTGGEYAVDAEDLAW